MASGELEKLIIQAYTEADYSGSVAGEFEVYINPDEYQLSYDVEYNQEQGQGSTASPMTFKQIKAREFSIKFMLDGTGVVSPKIDVSDTLDDFFNVVGYNGDIHRPNYLKLIWGDLNINCVLLKADMSFKLFKPSGKPLRVLVTANFKENKDDQTRVAEADDSSPDLTHIRQVEEGDTLPLMCYRIYGDPSYYLEVARVNQLKNFQKLEVGSEIFFPPLES